MLTHLQQQFAQLGCSDATLSMRQKGWRQFEALGLPTKENEAYRYLPLSRLHQQSYQLAASSQVSIEEIKKAVNPIAEHSYVVFVNGFFRPDLSDLSSLPPQVQVLKLSDAMRSHGSFLNHRISKALLEEKDPFAALNAAVHAEGLFFYVPPKVVLQTPVQCLFVQQESSNCFSTPRIHLFVGKEARVNWISSTLGLGHLNAFFDVALEEASEFFNVVQMAPSENSWHFEALRASLKRNSRLQQVSLFKARGCARQDCKILLSAEGAEASLYGLTALDERGHAHANLHLEHAAPYTQSMQRYKTLLKDTAQASFEGKIYVHPQAQKTQAYQLNNNLLLDDRAVANSKPNLEIFADDVKASHGVTIAQLDPALLFYLKTRGISEETARKLMTTGFCQEILQQLPYPFLAQQFQIDFNDPSKSTEA